MNNFIQYPKCSTCVKARKFLENNNINFNNRHIVDEPLTKIELERLIAKSNLPIKNFFNTCGVVYRELNLKEVLNDMTDSQKIELLASNGKLVKRPILETHDNVFVGFKEENYKMI